MTDRSQPQHPNAPRCESSQRRDTRNTDAANSRQKLESDTQSRDEAPMTCARCQCAMRKLERAAELNDRTLLAISFTMTQANGDDRRLCADCWLKEGTGDGELRGTSARSTPR